MIQNIADIYASLGMRYPAYAKVFRFLIAGGISTGTDLLLLYIFTEIFGIWYLASAIAAFILAFFVSFGLQKFWTFRDLSRDGISVQAGTYLCIAICNLALNTLIVYTLVDYVSLHYLVAQMIASILIACESFFVYQRFVFRRVRP